MASFGYMIRARRKVLGLSLRCLAGELGFCAPYLYDLEKGSRKLANPRYRAMAKALNVKLSDIVMWAGDCPHCSGTGKMRGRV